ncbi:MAG: BsuPI-related putative proteinase inhibitor [Peptostreptococcales bacterium]
MKANKVKNVLITGTLCATLLIPTYGQSTLPAHWAQIQIDQLAAHVDVSLLFQDKNLDNSITSEDFINLIRSTLDEEYDGQPESITREVIVHEMTKIWAAKTNQQLDEIATIKMIIYGDTSEIDPRYNHSVTVAYMKNIAIGKGEGLFDPKADVTYGEIATLINNTDKAIKDTLEKPIMEGRYETRGSYKIEDDKVVFDFELMSHYTETQKLQLSSGQQFEIIITDEEDKEVYRYSDGKFFTLALVMKDIGPGETLKWQDEWDMTNKEGKRLTSGNYKAKIKILVLNEEEKQVDEDQLTTILEFNLA